ncbi:DUF167 family protein [Devosia salina]|uniref:UPF0235 protein K1X15_19780 n=1 Tax=Devosia salina TaxID=2860336 RepID=A0ABX8WDI9_9HYPH|nr:DUF167 family protein [Devosia salina]QYO76781.1 DUF167 family protein [Devosia salina]
MSDLPGFARPTEAGLILHLRVTPNAGRDAIEGIESRDDGTSVLRVRVRAVPDKGKANAAVIALLAKALGVPKSALGVVSGETSRLKTLLVAPSTPDLVTRLAALAG